jgi:hypothetical protein
MTEMNTQVEIAAPPSRVWRALLDTRRWGALHRGVLADPAPDEPWQVGAERILRIRPFPWAPASSVKVRVEACEPFHLRWSSRGPGISAVRFFRVEPSDGGSRLLNSEHVDGFMPKVVPRFVTRALTRTHERWNEAFRDSVIAEAARAGR